MITIFHSLRVRNFIRAESWTLEWDLGLNISGNVIVPNFLDTFQKPAILKTENWVLSKPILLV